MDAHVIFSQKGVCMLAKFEVTPELAYTIRSVRTQKKVTAKAIAEGIDEFLKNFVK